MNQTTSTREAGTSMSTGRVLTVVGGGVVAAIGVVMLLGGLAFALAHSEGRDADGYYSSGKTRLSTGAYALSAEDVDLGSAADAVPKDVLGTVRVRAERPDGGRVFVGIGPERQVREYLRGVARAEVDDLDPTSYVRHPGGAPARPPAEEDFWVAQSRGSGRQTADWDADGGDWAVVAMNEDGARGVTVEADVGAKVAWLLPVGLGLAGGGLLLGAGGAALIVAAARRRRS